MQDWNHHKPFCRSDATELSVCSVNRDATTAERRPNPPKDANSEGLRPGTERAIDVHVGGIRVLQVVSSTMAPEALREARDPIEKEFKTRLRKEHPSL